MTVVQLQLTEIRRTCSVIGCEDEAEWLLRPGETCHCPEHAEGFYRAASPAYGEYLDEGTMVFVRIADAHGNR